MEPRGPSADSIAQLTVVMTVLGTLTFIGVMVVLAYALWGRRWGPEPEPIGEREPSGAAPGGDEREPPGGDATEHPTGLDTPLARRLIIGGGVLLPAVVIGLVLAWTLETMVELPEPGDVEDGLEVEVTAERWAWNFAYPGGAATTDELIIPAGRPIVLQLRSVDVIHSFWVPELAGKLDALPDRTNELVIEAAEPGRYRGQCAEFCGLQHSTMELTVTAVSDDEFEAWSDAAATSAQGTAGIDEAADGEGEERP